MLMRTSSVPCAIVFCLCVAFVRALGNLENGDICHHEEENVPGVCVQLQDCPEALNDIKAQKYPQICGFNGTLPIVCCKKKTTAPQKQRIPGEISQKKCWEYGELAYRQIEIPSFGIDSNAAKYINESACAVKPTFVHNGVDAGSREFPHMVLLGYGKKDITWACGGSLISDQFVLTAAHCLSAQSLGSVTWARIGDLDISKSTDDAEPQQFSIKARFRHPDYKRPSNYHDIALLQLDRPVNFTEYVRPACVHWKNDLHEKYVVTGWGHLDYDVKRLSDVLQKAEILGFTNGECNVKYEPYAGSNRLKIGVLEDSQICAGGRTDDKDTCPGDSGGPLQIYHPEVYCMYSVVGVTSFGQPRCGVTGIPAIYTRVSTYVKWIEDIVWP